MHIKQAGIQSKTDALWEDAFNEAFFLFCSKSMPVGLELLPIARRAIAGMGLEHYEASVNDLVYKIITLKKDYTKEQVVEGLGTIQALTWVYYPAAEQKARYSRRLLSSPDLAEITFHAQERVERKVWFGEGIPAVFTETGEIDAEASAKKITERIVLGFRYLPGYVFTKRHKPDKKTYVWFTGDYYGERNKDFIDPAPSVIDQVIVRVDGDPQEDDHFPAVSKKPARTKDISVAETKQRLYKAIDKSSPVDLKKIITSLSLKEQQIVLYQIGILKPDLTLDEFCTQAGIVSDTADNALVFAVLKLEKPSLLSQEVESAASPIETERVLRVARIGEKASIENSVRAEVASLGKKGMIDAKLLKKLTSQEKRILELAIAETDQGFAYVYSGISEITEQSVGMISLILGRIRDLIVTQSPRFIDCDDHPIPTHYDQFKLLTLTPEMASWQWANLGTDNQQVLRFVTTADSDGRYPTYTQFEKKFGLNHNSAKVRLQRILQIIQSDESVFFLRMRLNELLKDKVLTANEAMKADLLIQWINNGGSLRNGQGNFSFNAIAQNHSLSAHDFWSLSQKCNQI